MVTYSKNEEPKIKAHKLSNVPDHECVIVYDEHGFRRSAFPILETNGSMQNTFSNEDLSHNGSRTSGNALTSALSIPRYAHWPALSPSGHGRFAAFRSPSSRLQQSGMLFAPASVWNSGARRLTTVLAVLYALLVPFVQLPRPDIQT